MIVKIKNKLCKQDGEILITIFGRILITAIVLLLVLETFALVMHKQHVDYIAKQLAKTIEADGYVSQEIPSYLNKLNEQLGTSATYVVDGYVPCKAETAPSYAIQFRDGFTVTVSDTHQLVLASPIASKKDITMDIEITSKTSGRSEVFWK